MRLIRAVALAGGAQICAPAAAQDIIITGRGLPSEPLPGAATVAIDGDRIADSASGRLEDVLRDAAGIQSFRRSDSRSANPTSQGITLRGLGGNAASRALVVVDGVPQADPFGGWVAFPAYATGRIAAVSVTRGAGDGRFGAGALAGTIEIDSFGGDGGGASIDAGSRDAVDLQLGRGFALGSGFFTAHGQYARGDGFAPIVAEDRGPADRAAPYRQFSLATRAVMPVSADTELQASVSGFRDRRDRGLDFTDIASDGVDASVRVVGRGAWRWSALGYVQTRSFANRFASVDAARAVVTPTLDQYSVPSSGVGGAIELAPPIAGGSLRMGADIRAVEGTTHEFYSFVNASPTRRREAGGRSVTGGGYAQLRMGVGAATIGAALRLDHWTISGGRLFEQQIGGAILTDADYARRDGWEPSGRAGVDLRVSRAVTLRAAAYHAWRLPTLNELYRPFRLGADATAANPQLAPERLRGAEFGADVQVLPDATLGLTLFDNRLNGAIANVALANGPGNFPGVGFVSAAGIYRQRRNLDAIVSRGVEVDGRLVLRPIALRGSLSLVDAEVRGGALDGLPPAQTPRWQASLSGDWSTGPLALSVTGRGVGSQFEDDGGTRRLAAAWTLDGVARYAISRTLALELRGENVTDTRVEAGIAADGTVERATPRTIWLGLRWRRQGG